MEVGVKLAIALPCAGHDPKKEFWEAFTRLHKPFPWTFLTPKYPTDFYAGIADVRNELVRQSFESDCTSILMLDTDQTPEPDLIVRLFKHNLPIVSARVHRRYPPYDPIMRRRSPANANRFEGVPVKEWGKGGLIEVDRTGVAACGLFDMTVFENVPFPWFESKSDDPTKGTKRLGEDFCFCDKLRKAGYKIYVDSSLEVGHLINFTVTKEFHFLWMKLQEISKKK